MLPSQTSTDFLAPSLQLIPPPSAIQALAELSAKQWGYSVLFYFYSYNWTLIIIFVAPFWTCSPLPTFLTKMRCSSHTWLSSGSVPTSGSRGACGVHNTDRTDAQSCDPLVPLIDLTCTIEFYCQIRLFAHDSFVPILPVFLVPPLLTIVKIY